MKNFVRILLAGAVLATAAFAQENTGANGPAEDQKQAPAADSQSCCNKDCCKHKSAKKAKAGNGETAKKDSMACCK